MLRVEEIEWIGGRYTFPATIRDGDSVLRPEVILWLELPSGILVGSGIIDPRKPMSFAESLDEAMRRPAEGSPRRPTRIRVPETRLALALREVAGNIPVVVAPVPELDETFADFRKSIPDNESEPSYLANGAIALSVVADLFTAASLLFRAAPWRYLSDQQTLRVDIPTLDVDGACLSIIGAAGESFGLLLFRSLDDFQSFAVAAQRSHETERPAPRTNHELALLSLSFDRKNDLHPSLVYEIELHRWPVAGAKAYPSVLAIDASMKTTLPLTERYFRILTACTRAFLTFFEHNRDVFDEDNDVQPVAQRITGADGITVTLTAPYGPSTPFDVEVVLAPIVASPTTASAAHTLGRNNPCHCGSGRKYKNCHFAADRAGNPA